MYQLLMLSGQLAKRDERAAIAAKIAALCDGELLSLYFLTNNIANVIPGFDDLMAGVVHQELFLNCLGSDKPYTLEMVLANGETTQITGISHQNKILAVISGAAIDTEAFMAFAGLLPLLYSTFKGEQSSPMYEQGFDENKAWFIRIIDSTPLHIWTANANGEVDYINQRTAADIGRLASELVGNGWIDVLHPDDCKKTLEIWQHALDTGEEYHAEFRILGADQEYRWYMSRALPIYEHGKIVHWFGANTDIHDQKLSELKRDEFINLASHELKTPMTSIKAFIHLLGKSFEKDVKVSSFINKTLQHTDRLEKLIDNMLDVSRINRGKLSYNLDLFDFDAVVYECVEAVQQSSPGHDIIVDTSLDLMYRGDKVRIKQVLNNFLANAVKYSPNADRVIISTQREQNNIIISVQDFGIGIDPQNMHKLFNRFYKANNEAMQHQGLGLGLYISSEIIKKHNGTFWIESEAGKGSTFYCLLPINGTLEFKELDTDGKSFYKATYIEVRYNERHNRLDVDWIGYQNSNSVKLGCNVMLDLLIKNNCSKILTDNTRVAGNWSEAADWAGETWLPIAERAGLQNLGWVYSQVTFSNLAAEKSIMSEANQVTIVTFTDRDAASKWLDEV